MRDPFAQLEIEKMHLLDAIDVLEKKQSIFAPIKDQFVSLVEYINILERKSEELSLIDINNLIEYIELKIRYCDMYLRYISMKEKEKIR